MSPEVYDPLLAPEGTPCSRAQGRAGRNIPEDMRGLICYSLNTAVSSPTPVQACLTGEQLCSTSACPSVSFAGLWGQPMLSRREVLGLRQYPHLDYYSKGTKRGEEGKLVPQSPLDTLNPSPWPSPSLPPASPPSFSSFCLPSSANYHTCQ